MTIKTARISFFVEYDDASPHGPPAITHENCPDDMGDLLAINVHNVQMIGTPRVDHHTLPMCSLSYDEVRRIVNRVEDYAGAFDTHIGRALAVADSENKQRLTEEFWNLLCKYRPAS